MDGFKNCRSLFGLRWEGGVSLELVEVKEGLADASDVLREPIPSHPKVLESHVSLVFLVGDRAYKVKKPLKTGFLDFSTREARLTACNREVEVNRRFAPDVYKGVASIVGNDGAPCDHLVVMKRMPENRRMSNLAVGKVGEGELEALARLIAHIHRTAPRSDRISEDGTLEALRRRWSKNFDELHDYAGRYIDPDQLEVAEEMVTRYLAGRGPLFERRVADGRIVDGHGDLLAGDIYLLDDGPRILDALEFDESLRHLDVIDDVAFLVMDLKRLGAPDLASELMTSYVKVSGDSPSLSLVSHYVAYRALVRAKVACMRADQGDPDSETPARLLMGMAVEHLEEGRVVLALVGGLPGSGKSTLAKALGEARGWEVLSSDVVRKELAGITPTTPAPSAYREGIYSPTFTAKTYSELLRMARLLLEQGVSVVIDASWIDHREREKAADLARSTVCDLVEFHLSVPAHEGRSRIVRRAGANVSTTSDATVDIVDAMAKDEQPWPYAVEIDANDSSTGMLEKVLQSI